MIINNIKAVIERGMNIIPNRGKNRKPVIPMEKSRGESVPNNKNKE